MNSVYLKKDGYDVIEIKKEKIDELPKSKGLYAFVLDTDFCRMKGKSDILYIGKTSNKKGIRQRIRWYLKPTKEQETNIRIKKFIDSRNGKVKLFFKVCNNERIEEKKLLYEYLKQHDELPPLNRSL